MVEHMIQLYHNVSKDLILFNRIINDNFPENEFSGIALQELKINKDSFIKEWCYDKLETLKQYERQIYFLLDYVEFKFNNKVDFWEYKSDLMLFDFSEILYRDLFNLKQSLENLLQGYKAKPRSSTLGKNNKRENEAIITQNQSALLYRYFSNILFNCKQKDWVQAIHITTGLQPNERIFSELDKNRNTLTDLKTLSQKLKEIAKNMDAEIDKKINNSPLN